MIHFLKKTIKIGLWGLVPLLLVSNKDLTNEIYDTSVDEGTYSLRATGALNIELKGPIRFETTLQTSSDNIPFSTLELKLGNSEKTVGHTMGFLISEQDRSHEISVGTYELSNNTGSLLNNFDGVFGFMDINTMGEKPFFAYKGKISVTSIEGNPLYGNIVMHLRNSKKRGINISGSFIAIKSE